jgi:hypothetical protein
MLGAAHRTCVVKSCSSMDVLSAALLHTRAGMNLHCMLQLEDFNSGMCCNNCMISDMCSC